MVSDKHPPQDIPIAKAAETNPIPEGAKRITATHTASYTSFHKHLQESFAQDFSEQGKRLDETAKQLLTLQIALPSVFAALLKLLAGKDAFLAMNDVMSTTLVCGAFISWIAAVFFSLRALKPEHHQVNPNVLENRSTDKTFFGLLDFYQHNAARKHQHISVSTVLTVLGLVLMISHLFFQGVQ